MRMHLPMRIGCASMRIDAHHPHIVQKNVIQFFTYKLPFWLRFSKFLGQEPHQLTNISYVESGEVLSFCVNEAREFIQLYFSGTTPSYQGSNWTSLRITEIQ